MLHLTGIELKLREDTMAFRELKGKAVSEGQHGADTVEWTEEVIFKDQF